MIGRDPQLSLNIMAGFARWVRQFNQLLSEYTKAVPSRLAGYLIAEALRTEFKDYGQAIIDNARVCRSAGIRRAAVD